MVLHLKRHEGFTLVEVMVVAAILVLLAGVAVPQLFKSFEDARRQKLEVDAKQIQVVMDRAVLDARLKGVTVNNINKKEMTPTVLSESYGLTLTVTDGVKFYYEYKSATGAAYSVVTVDYNSSPKRTYSTYTGKWDPP